MSKPVLPEVEQLPPTDVPNRLAKLPTYLHLSDLQGLSQLATQGVLGVAGLAETVQGNVYKAVAASFGHFIATAANVALVAFAGWIAAQYDLLPV